MGSCVLPMQEVLSAVSTSSFAKALPLREATETTGDEPLMRSELFVKVTREGGQDLQIPPLQEQSADKLRMKTSQIRVTMRKLHVEEHLAIEKGTVL